MAKITHPKVIETVPIGNLVYVVLEIPAPSFTITTAQSFDSILLKELGIAELYGASMLMLGDGINSMRGTDYNDGGDRGLTVNYRPFLTQSLSSYALSPDQEPTTLIGNITNGDGRINIVSGGENVIQGDLVSSPDFDGGANAPHRVVGIGGGNVSTVQNASQTKSNVEFRVSKRIDLTHKLSVSSNINGASTINSAKGLLTLIGRRG